MKWSNHFLLSSELEKHQASKIIKNSALALNGTSKLEISL
uniref:Uncharacterized protein n=1 Tax=Tetranychus urticae TaxID=32264 RepID=T1KJ38_TETUR